MLTGITVSLHVKTLTGHNDINEPIYTEQVVEVPNVLVAPVTDTDVLSNTDLSGGKAVYTLAIPKDDNHTWEDVTVEFWGETWKTTGIPTKGIVENIPLSWNTKVTVERYE